jgi:hypothetical protein
MIHSLQYRLWTVVICSVLVIPILFPSSSSLQVLVVNAHSRWVCPPPRNPDTAIKTGPCGTETNVFTKVDIPLNIEPGPLLVQWEESIYHTGAPFRIALSQDGSDDDPCILIDHIPHFDDVTTFPIFGNDSTYILYSLTIDIPDIQCDSCSLHLANPMTDKIGDDGSPTGIGCTDPLGTCFSVYHSCTIPITIMGSTPRSQYACPNTNPIDWPTTWSGDNGASVDASTIGIYRREAATWEQSFLLDVTDNYRTFDTSTLLTCTNTELFPTQINAPTTGNIFAPTPTSVPIFGPTEAPVSITVSPTVVTISTPPTSAPVTTSDAAQIKSAIQNSVERFMKIVMRATALIRALF